MISRTNDDGVIFGLEYPNSFSRLQLLLKTVLGGLFLLPHVIILALYYFVSGIVTLIAFIAILINGRYPENLFGFMTGFHRWRARVIVYSAFMTEQYPPFSPDGLHTVELEVPHPGQISRLKAIARFLFGWLYISLPHGIILFFYAIAVGVVISIGWWSILLFGNFPQGLFRFVEGYLRWKIRVQLYSGFITDRYPTFNGAP